LKKAPDSSFRPNPRPDWNDILTAALVQIQPVFGHAWPTIVFEAGHTQTAPQLVKIRDRVLGWKTQVNVFLTAVYDRNANPATDSWWVQLSFRDIYAPIPPPNADDTYPACVVAAELPKFNGRCPRVETQLPPNAVWSVPTTLLYHPQPGPLLQPPLPPTFDIDLERYRQAILRTR